MTMKRLLWLALLAIPITSCGDKATEFLNDAPRLNNIDTAAATLSFPDGFSNVAAKCFGTDMVYVAFHGDANRAAVAVSPSNPMCRDGVLTREEQQR